MKVNITVEVEPQHASDIAMLALLLTLDPAQRDTPSPANGAAIVRMVNKALHATITNGLLDYAPNTELVNLSDTAASLIRSINQEIADRKETAVSVPTVK